MTGNVPGPDPKWKKIWDAEGKHIRPKFVSIAEAVRLTNELGIQCTHSTMIKWCKVTGIGWRIGRRWYVRVKKLARFLEEEPVFYEDPEQNGKRD